MSNALVQVNVRIETGSPATSLDLTVQTRGRDVQPNTGPARRADGTNGNEFPLPGPTCTSALDDASRPPYGPRPFTWDGTYFLNFDDLLITTINNVSAVDRQTFWSLWVNFTYANIGGGQLQIKNGDSVLWALIPTTFNGPVPVSIPLKLKGPRLVPPNTNFSVTAINGSNRSPVQNAIVRYNDVTLPATDSNGSTTVPGLTTGNYTLKATRGNDISSNPLNIVAT